MGSLAKTLNHRIQGRETRAQAQEINQKLSSAQEKRIAKWIVIQEALGFAPSHTQVRATTSRLLVDQGQSSDLGRHWMERFIKQNPEVKTKLGIRICEMADMVEQYHEVNRIV